MCLFSGGKLHPNFDAKPGLSFSCTNSLSLWVVYSSFHFSFSSCVIETKVFILCLSQGNKSQNMSNILIVTVATIIGNTYPDFSWEVTFSTQRTWNNPSSVVHQCGLNSVSPERVSGKLSHLADIPLNFEINYTRTEKECTEFTLAAISWL